MKDKNKMPSHHGVKEFRDDKYPNQTLKLLIERASCRNFADKKIPPDVLQYIFEAGIHAPTGGNLQPFSIIKIEKDEPKRKLAELCAQNFIAKAPVNLLFCIDFHRLERWAKLEVAPFTATSSFRHFWISIQDTIICAQNICTAADSLGLGSVYIGTVVGYFRELRDMFELPDGVLPVVLLCLGYPETKPQTRKKLAVDVIVHDEKYHDMEDQELIDAFEKKYPDVKIMLTDERLEEIYKVCLEVHGKEFADKCVEKIKKNGYINIAQRYFGLHYSANIMPLLNDMYIGLIEELGFKWFNKYQPYEDKET